MPLPLSERASLDGQKKAELVKRIHEEARSNLKHKTELYTKQANKGRKELVFNEGDMVWVHLRKERFPTERNSKLKPRIDGPFQITKKINNNAYQLDLQGKYNVSPSFNVSDLLPFCADETDLRTNPSQVGEDDMIMASSRLEDDQDQEEKEEEDQNQDQEDLQVPLGPMTRAKTKRFQEAFTTLLLQVQGQLKCADPTTLVVIQAT